MSELISLPEAKSILKKNNVRLEVITPIIAAAKDRVINSSRHNSAKGAAHIQARIDYETATLENQTPEVLSKYKKKVEDLWIEVDSHNASEDAARAVWRKYETEEKKLLEENRQLQFRIENDSLIKSMETASPALRDIAKMMKDIQSKAAQNNVKIELPDINDFFYREVRSDKNC
jgi:hypothetical protein